MSIAIPFVEHRRAPTVLASVLLVLLAVLPALVWAHAGSKSRLVLQVSDDQVEGRLVASLIDVALVLGLDPRTEPGQLRSQVAARRGEVLAYVARGLVVLADGERQRLVPGDLTVARRDGDDVLELHLRAGAAARIEALDVGYTLFFEDDVLHECLARVEWDGGAAVETVFRLGEPLQHLERRDGASSGFLQFVRSGILHIWTGYDHVLFLLALLLPSVLQPALRSALSRTAIIVTAFTLAHSVTLACASLGWIRLPQQPVEAAIALSVFIAAACNFAPAAARLGGPWMAFAFGLLHGFGFASVLAELMPRSGEVWRPLLAFNLGVEVGQLAIVAVFLPLAWLLRDTRTYRVGVVGAGSAAVCACAMTWFVARAF